jgi:hypoxanthine phosphoribosyltransferase
VTAVEQQAQVGRPIYGAEAISQAVERLAATVASDYRRQPLILLGVLKGALCFTSDLARALARQADGPSEILVDYICVGRYGALGTSGGEPRLLMDAGLPFLGTHVLIADTIVDDASTIRYVRALLRERNPASLRTCALFDKRARREGSYELDYTGLEVGPVFAIGYGLDYKELYRNLPYLAELREEQTV